MNHDGFEDGPVSWRGPVFVIAVFVAVALVAWRCGS